VQDKKREPTLCCNLSRRFLYCRRAMARTRIQQGRIDVHHHLVPPPFRQAMEGRGITHVAGAPLPKWTPEASIDVMDANGIGTAVTALSAPDVYFGSGPKGITRR
jgi:6-methylsalicylate decarboxylase